MEENLKARPHRAWWTAGIVLLAITFAAGAFNYVWNADVFWHLAAGKQMVHTGAILDSDPFTAAPDRPDTPRVNVYWLFQIVITLIHMAGGFELLTVLKSALAVCILLALALPLRREVPAGWLAASALAMLIIMLPRLRVRPELFTLAFLMLAVSLTESTRRDGRTGRLWWLAPIMLVWANMHGLFILGLGIIWAGVIGSLIDRLLKRPDKGGPFATQRATVPIVAATVMCFITLWPIESFLHPFMLLTRISGQAFYFTYGVSELRPTWEVLSQHGEAITVFALVVLAMIINLRSVPASHVIWLAAFTLIGLAAIRNVGLAAPVFGYLLAFHGGRIIRRIAAARPKLARAGGVLTAIMLLASAALAGAFVTEYYWKFRRTDHEFGAGLQKNHYAVQTAKFLRDLPTEGDILCGNFGDAGVFLYHSYPQRQVWMDGRLEVHSEARFIRQHEISKALDNAYTAGRVKLPPCVRFIVIGAESTKRLTALSQCPRFRMIHISPSAVCFARVDWPGGQAGDDLPRASNLNDYDRILESDGQVESVPQVRWRWYRQNPQSLSFRLGKMFLSMGDTGGRTPSKFLPTRARMSLLAVRYLTAALNETPRDPVVAGLLARAHLDRAIHCGMQTTLEYPIEINLCRALNEMSQFDLSDLSDDNMQALAFVQALVMVAADQIDTADKAVSDILAHLPPRQRVNPPSDYSSVRNKVSMRLDRSRELLAQIDKSKSLEPIERAMLLQQIGLIDKAISELRALAKPSPAAVVLLGDMLLQKGQADEARRTYLQVRPSPRDKWKLSLRLALCDWTEGHPYVAVEKLEELLKSADRAVVRYYLAVIWEQIGDYNRTLAAAGQAQPDDAADPLLTRVLRRIVER